MTIVNPAQPVPERLITWYLHMTDPTQFVPAGSLPPEVIVLPLRQPDVRYYKFLYTAVGEGWRWRDRILMPEDELEGLISRDSVSIHVLYVRGAPAGYFELVREADGDTELAYFGLRPEYARVGAYLQPGRAGSPAELSEAGLRHLRYD
jgi:hypothetical protein